MRVARKPDPCFLTTIQKLTVAVSKQVYLCQGRCSIKMSSITFIERFKKAAINEIGLIMG